MRQTLTDKTQQEWLKILGKGMVTIPKNWRDELGLKKGEVVRAQKMGSRVILEARQEAAPYRVYSDEEIEEFLKVDKLPKPVQEKVDRRLKLLKSA